MTWTTSDYLSLGAIIISAIALLMPLWQMLYQKLFKPAKLNVIPFNKTAFLYNESGSYAKMKFSINCKNQDIVINKIAIEITNKRKLKTETLFLDWNFFEPVNLSWLGSDMSNRINTTAYARPIKVTKNSIEPCIIEFSNNDQDVINELNSLSDKRSNAINDFIAALPSKDNVKVQDVIDGFKKEKIYNDFYAGYEKFFFWEAGDYSLTVHIEYDNKKKYSQTFHFLLDSQDTDEMKKISRKLFFAGFCLGIILHQGSMDCLKIYRNRIEVVNI